MCDATRCDAIRYKLKIYQKTRSKQNQNSLINSNYKFDQKNKNKAKTILKNKTIQLIGLNDLKELEMIYN